MTKLKSPPDLRADEHLGRRVFSRRQRRNARVRWRAFYDWKAHSLSVDCLDRTTLVRLMELATRAAETREGAKAFYGWLAILVGVARLHGRSVGLTPRPDNPFHADIVLPGAAETDEERKARARKHAQLLAEQALFVSSTNSGRSLRRTIGTSRRKTARSR